MFCTVLKSEMKFTLIKKYFVKLTLYFSKRFFCSKCNACQKFRENDVFTKEITIKVDLTKYFSVRVNFVKATFILEKLKSDNFTKYFP